MIVNSAISDRAKLFLKEIEEDGITLAWAKTSAACGKDEACCLAVWQMLPIGSKIRNFLYERIKVQAENQQSESLQATAVLYLMSSPEDQKKLRSKLQDLINKKSAAWELIKDEPGLETVA